MECTVINIMHRWCNVPGPKTLWKEQSKILEERCYRCRTCMLKGGFWKLFSHVIVIHSSLAVDALLRHCVASKHNSESFNIFNPYEIDTHRKQMREATKNIDSANAGQLRASAQQNLSVVRCAAQERTTTTYENSMPADLFAMDIVNGWRNVTEQ